MSEWKPFTLPMIPGVPQALDAAQQAAGILGLLRCAPRPPDVTVLVAGSVS